ncbi:sulfotransferase domain-containing protein [Streptomyces sp. NBC_01565]|uniref:sulfotransferase domain-containing protein n=1 Tax=unclassified Streptomyces TaxID=2593676 RepID=UPI00224CE9D4|nr:sulfotransferase domain-containing protein [Streptomyces sp. NBC_01565]MCX4546978.1 sulfotransferase domain-containing protein [Streptomyces sp. NBC_01565]
MDSTHWDRYRPRACDIVISTPPKAGTTWTQRIVSVLVFQSVQLRASVSELSPWLDSAFKPLDKMLEELERQRHRRFIKTHLPVDALPVYSEVSYLVVGRDLRDTALSAHNHAAGVKRAGQPAVTKDIRAYWDEYFTRSIFDWEPNGWPFNSPTHHLQSWWAHRDQPNVLFLHYQDMLDDLDREMRRVSAFLGVPVDEARWPELVEECTFSTMKAKQDEVFPGKNTDAVAGFEFFHKGRNGQWRDVVTDEQLALYRAAVAALPGDLRAWLTRSE